MLFSWKYDKIEDITTSSEEGGGLMNSDLDNNSYLILVGESSHTVRVRNKVLFGNWKYFIYVFNLDWKRRYNDKSTTDQLICHLVQISSPIL